jgi:hypothetical protein
MFFLWRGLKLFLIYNLKKKIYIYYKEEKRKKTTNSIDKKINWATETRTREQEIQRLLSNQMSHQFAIDKRE